MTHTQASKIAKIIKAGCIAIIFFASCAYSLYVMLIWTAFIAVWMWERAGKEEAPGI